MTPDWMKITISPKGTVAAQPCVCNSGIPRVFPQSVGDAAMTVNPGSITGEVQIFRPIPRILKMQPQALTPTAIDPWGAPRVVLRYPPGQISAEVPMDERTQLIWYGVV